VLLHAERYDDGLVGASQNATVVLGDFNEWFRPASLRGALGRELPARTQYATFPSWYPLFRLDRIFCPPPDAMRASFVDRSARIVSDHLPVVADIQIC
jgi:endonuclease/exonuclease/phosphatase family metal-dependent hydrolase